MYLYFHDYVETSTFPNIVIQLNYILLNNRLSCFFVQICENNLFFDIWKNWNMQRLFVNERKIWKKNLIKSKTNKCH